ncbi:hypothetical protein FOZ62_007836 [Perkinsus olseni]|uniref:Uncharacterized protein n=2 Tax=Perkinsus olseni TaxID=32597 RepID=A0A7J6QW79_PEROL|nr:hypothetical protein FOZ62_007836 [Perkinsus olseni]
MITALATPIPTLVIMFLNATVSTSLFAISGFGNAISYQIIWYVMGLITPYYCDGSVVTGAVHVALHAPLMSLIQFLKLWRTANYWLAAYLSIAAAAAAAPCTMLLDRLQSEVPILRSVLGTILSALALWQTFNEIRRYVKTKNGSPSDDVPRDLDLSPKGPMKLKLGALAVGCASGAMNGLFSIGGPPNMIFVLLTNPDPLCWRSTSATMNVVVHVFTRLPVLLTGSLLNNIDLWAILVLNIGAVCGLVLGNWLSRYVSVAVFRASIDVFLVVSSFMMTPMYILIPLICAVALLLVVKLCWYKYKEHRNHGTEGHKPLLP